MNPSNIVPIADHFPHRNPGANLQQSGDDGYTLVNTDGGWLATLNAPAALVWSLCDGRHSVAGILRDIDKILDDTTSADRRAPDILEVLGDLAERNLIHFETMRDEAHSSHQTREMRTTVSHGLGRGGALPRRTVVFYGSFHGAGYRLGAELVMEQLRRRGIDAVSGEHIPIDEIRDSCVVIVWIAHDRKNRRRINTNERIGEVLEGLKSRGNTVVYDVRDFYGFVDPENPARYGCDAIIFPTRSTARAFFRAGGSSARCRVIYGFCDPDILSFNEGLQNNRTRFRVAYFGRPAFAPAVARERYDSIFPEGQVKIGEHLDNLSTYCLHLDVNTQRAHGSLKPLTKVFTAAGCNANIIADRSERVLEVLADDYPFLIESESQLPDMIEYAAGLFGTPAWSEAMECMRQVRRDFTIERYMDHFMALLDSL